MSIMQNFLNVKTPVLESFETKADNKWLGETVLN